MRPDDIPPAEAPSPRDVAATASSVRPWVPVRSLSERHRPRVLAHIQALPEHDRYMRFGYAASDAQIASYVDRIDFETDAVFGIFNRRLQLVALAHLALLPEDPVRADRQAEFGVSVLPHARRRGFASRLFEHCVLFAATRGVSTLLVYALSENAGMLRIAQRAGAAIERSGGDAEAVLRLAPATWRDSWAAKLEDRAADWDYLLKVQGRRWADTLNWVDEMRRDIAEEVESSGGLGRE